MFLSKHGRSYYIFFTDSSTGRRHKLSTGATTKSDALKFLKSHRADQLSKTHTNRLRISEYEKKYSAYSRAVHTAATADTYRDAFRQFLKITGDKLLFKITPEDIHRFIAAKTSEASAWSARKYFIALSSAFETARQWGLLMKNPFREVKRPKVPQLLPVYLTREDILGLLSVVDDSDYYDLIMLALFTGMRSGEIRTLRWENIDIAAGVIALRNTAESTTKGKKDRVIPMSNGCKALLMKRRKSQLDNELIFSKAGRALTKDFLSKQFRKYANRARLSKAVHFHTLRHTFCALLVQSGNSLYQVQ